MNKGVDLYVRGVNAFGEDVGRVPDDVLAEVAAIDGVARAVPSVEGFARLIDADGDPIGGSGPPTFGFSYVPEGEGLTPLRIAAGAYPLGPGEVMIDAFSAEANDIAVGDHITVVVVTGPESFDVVGLAAFGEAENLLGATLALFDLDTAQRVLGSVGEFSTIAIVIESGADRVSITAQIGSLLPEGVEVVTGEAQLEDDLAEVDEGLGFLNTALLVFAGVAVFVGTFIIQNTFRIIVAQRTKELALLRVVGATGGQVLQIVVIEALLIGIAASIVGIGVGVLLALGIRVIFETLGFGAPPGPLTILPRTIVVGLIVGIVVTLVSAVVPARKAARIAPVAALREVGAARAGGLRRRAAIGALVTAAGAVTLLTGLFGPGGIALVGFGAVVGFIGVSVLAPLGARFVARWAGRVPLFLVFEALGLVVLAAIGAGIAALVGGLVGGSDARQPFAFGGFLAAGAALGWWYLRRMSPERKTLGVTARLARDNAMRLPRRTAATASALMIGLALVSLIAVLASSIKGSVAESLREDFDADFQIAITGFSDPRLTGLSPELHDRLERVPEVVNVSRMRIGEWRIPGESSAEFLLGVDAEIDETVVLDVLRGTFDDLTGDTALLSRDRADDLALTVGDTLQIEVPSGIIVPVTIVGVFGNEDALNTPLLIPIELYERNYSFSLDRMLLMQVAPGTAEPVARAAVDAVAVEFPDAEVSNEEEFIERTAETIDQLLNLINALLFLAILIALLGITNTLALSIFERRREIGLLRAVGTTRTQVRRAVRWEAIIIAIFGGLLGLVVGVVLGVAVVAAIGQGLTIAVPGGQLLGYLVVAALGGVLASIGPARRGARLDVLEAIAYE